jgi:hypothetical protein
MTFRHKELVMGVLVVLLFVALLLPALLPLLLVFPVFMVSCDRPKVDVSHDVRADDRLAA